MKRWKVGIIGAGIIAREHAMTLEKLPQVEQVTIYDQDADRAEQVAAQYSAVAVPTLGDLISSCDIVWMCTPPLDRRELVLAACHAGRPIFCEKPLALSKTELKWTQETIKEYGNSFFMGQSNRYLICFQDMKKLVDDGAIGEVTGIWSTRYAWMDPKTSPPWRLDESLSGGTLIEQGVHEIDFMRWIAGEFKRVSAVGTSRTLVPGKFQDAVSAIGIIGDGINARLDISWANPRYLWQRGIDGTKGSLFFGDTDINRIEHHRIGADPLFHKVEWNATRPGENSSLQLQAADVLKALETQSAPPVTMEDGAAAVRVAIDMRESVKTGQVVKCAHA